MYTGYIVFVYYAEICIFMHNLHVKHCVSEFLNNFLYTSHFNVLSLKHPNEMFILKLTYQTCI